MARYWTVISNQNFQDASLIGVSICRRAKNRSLEISCSRFRGSPTPASAFRLEPPATCRRPPHLLTLPHAQDPPILMRPPWRLGPRKWTGSLSTSGRRVLEPRYLSLSLRPELRKATFGLPRRITSLDRQGDPHLRLLLPARPLDRQSRL